MSGSSSLLKDFKAGDLINSIRKENNGSCNPSENGSSNSSSMSNMNMNGNGNGGGGGGGGGGNNSDNSALISIGNHSFGFNFDDSEENNSSSPRNSNCGGTSEEGENSDQDGSNRRPTASSSSSGNGGGGTQEKQQQRGGGSRPQQQQQQQQQQQHQHMQGGKRSDLPSQRPAGPFKPPVMNTLSAGAAAAKISGSSSGSLGATSSSTCSFNTKSNSAHSDAAAAAVANLQCIADASNRAATLAAEEKQQQQQQQQSLKRKASSDCMGDNDSGGYNSDDDEGGRFGRRAGGGGSSIGGGKEGEGDESLMDEEDDDDCCGGEDGSSAAGGRQKGQPRRKKQLDNMKREERNAREKERSFRISRQINELRGLLSSGGVIVPKGTKSSVLTEAANYIRMLQQHQYRSEIDRHQMVQQIQMIGGGALGQQAATAVRHVAAQNGVWSLGNFGGVPPKSAMMYHQSSAPGAADTTPSSSAEPDGQASQDGGVLPSKIEEPDYRHVFNSCTVGMAIASMGGAFIDCNQLFGQLANYTKQEVCAMTIFNLTARQDLQPAFDLISQMLSSAPSDPNASSTSCVLRGSFKHRTDLGLNVTLIKGEDGVAKCFCVTLILNPRSPFDTSRPVPATFDHVVTAPLSTTKDQSQAAMEPTPAYTAG